MEVASQHCETEPNKTNDIFNTVKTEKIYLTSGGVQYSRDSSV